jgi:hypothetical protein
MCDLACNNAADGCDCRAAMIDREISECIGGGALTVDGRSCCDCVDLNQHEGNPGCEHQAMSASSSSGGASPSGGEVVSPEGSGGASSGGGAGDRESWCAYTNVSSHHSAIQLLNQQQQPQQPPRWRQQQQQQRRGQRRPRQQHRHWQHASRRRRQWRRRCDTAAGQGQRQRQRQGQRQQWAGIVASAAGIHEQVLSQAQQAQECEGGAHVGHRSQAAAGCATGLECVHHHIILHSTVELDIVDLCTQLQRE